MNPSVDEMFSVTHRPGAKRPKVNGGPASIPTPALQADTRKMIGANGKPLGDMAPWPPKGQAAPSKDPRESGG
jgi:hypothetical protein